MNQNSILKGMIWTGLALLLLYPAGLSLHAGQKAMDPLPVSARILLKKVRTCMDEKDYAGAIAAIKTGENPKGSPAAGEPPCSHPLVCLALGNCHLLLSDYGHAEPAYLAALDMDPSFMDARVNLAKVYADSSQYHKAAEAFYTAYGLSDPKHADYLYFSAVMALAQEETPIALDRFETLFSKHPDKVTPQWKANFLSALMTAKRWDQAIPLARELTQETRGKEQIKWQETLLQIYLAANDLKGAKTYAQTLSRQAPTMARWWKALVHVNLSLGNYSRALEDLVVYNYLAPLSKEEQKLYADLSLQLEIPARAAQSYEALLKEGSKKETGLVLNLINAYRQLGKGEKALALLDRFDPETCDPELLIVKGDLLYEAKDFKRADQAYRLAARSNCTRKGQAWLMAGYAAWQHNDIQASRTAFEQAARYKRHRKNALAAIARLERTRQM